MVSQRSNLPHDGVIERAAVPAVGIGSATGGVELAAMNQRTKSVDQIDPDQIDIEVGGKSNHSEENKKEKESQ